MPTEFAIDIPATPFDLTVDPSVFQIQRGTDTHRFEFDPVEVEFVIRDIQEALGPEAGVKTTCIIPKLIEWFKQRFEHGLRFAEAYGFYHLVRNQFDLAKKKLESELMSPGSTQASTPQN